jgi:D-xylose transport system permease protein
MSTDTTMSTVTQPSQETESGAPGPSSIVQGYLARLRGGDVGALPAVLGLVVLVTLFTVLRPHAFANLFNAANLLNQSARVMFIAMGLVFVLLLGEIDLSAGFTAGTAAAVLAVLSSQNGLAWPIAVLGSLAVGAVIGAAIGLLVSRLGIPSFVVSLAFFLGLQGVMLLVIGEGGTIRIGDPAILSIMNDNLSPLLSWLLFVVVSGGYALTILLKVRRGRAHGVNAIPVPVAVLKVLSLTLLLGVGTFALVQERAVNPTLASIRGVPMIVPFTIVFMVGLTFLLTRTSFGRHVYAVGGNAEAARRAGINVKGIKVTCFVISSTLAAIAGILIASRDNSVSPQSGGSITLLLAVAAAVIGGTSLFGGKGRIVDAVLGGLVIAVIDNGLPLITQKAGIQFIVTAGVLLLAASVDALARRRAAASGQ